MTTAKKPRTPYPPERIHGWPACSATARHFGGLTVQGHHYTIAYDDPGQPLVRDDVLAAEAKAANVGVSFDAPIQTSPEPLPQMTEVEPDQTPSKTGTKDKK